MRSRYELATNVQEAVEATDLVRVVDDVIDRMPDTFTPSGFYEFELIEYLRSPAFRKLSATEKAAAARTLKVFDDPDDNDAGLLYWRVVTAGNDNEPTLFSAPATQNLQAELQDGDVLSGALGGLMMLEAPRKTAEVLNMLPNTGARQKQIILGAAAVNRLLMVGGSDSAGSYGREDPYGLVRTISVGGTLHGDFRMWERHRWTKGATAPTGEFVPIAPIQETEIGAYHSSELQILFGIINYVRYSGHVENASENLRRTFVKALAVLQEGGVKGNFGDFGDPAAEPYVRQLVSPEFTPFLADMSHPLATDVFDANSKAGFVMQAVNQGIEFRQTYEGEIRSTITVADDEMEDFILILIKQATAGMGRTSPESLLQLLKATATL